MPSMEVKQLVNDCVVLKTVTFCNTWVVVDSLVSSSSKREGGLNLESFSNSIFFSARVGPGRTHLPFSSKEYFLPFCHLILLVNTKYDRYSVNVLHTAPNH